MITRACRFAVPEPCARRTFALALLAAVLLALVPADRSAAAGAAPITVSFDHLPTGFELDGVHRDLPCESCHLNAVFKGTPRNCGVCHITGSVYDATPKIATHIQSTNNCAACHNTLSFRPDVHFQHSEVLGTCVSCHNGTIAQGEGRTHPATSQACQACHTVVSWNPPKSVDHTQIPMAAAGFCIICHNGQSASGKPANHIATALECGDCHLTSNWLGASFNHSGILTGCFTCHNGVKAVGKQANHMPTSNACETCHTTGIGSAAPSWVPSGFAHTQMAVTTCATCHSGALKISGGATVSGPPSNHVPLVPSAPDCGVCHGNTPTAETWKVLSASIATLHTGLNVKNCLLCHAGESFAGVPAPYIPMTISGISPRKTTPLVPAHIPILAGTDCSSCHNQAYTAGGFGPATAMTAATHAFVSTTCDSCHDTGKSFYVGSGTALQLRPADHVSSSDPRMATGDCSLCHETKDWLSTALPTGHMPNPGNLACSTCHAAAPGDYTPATLAANSILHTGISGNCGLCHGNNVAALVWFNNFTPKDALLTPSHIPYLAGTDCSSCHSSSTYAVGTFGPMNMTQAKHAFTPPACNTCHEAGLSLYMGVASPALQGRPADHNSGQLAAPNDCSLCHTTANWSSNMLPAGHMPNPGNQGCTVCHTAAPADYTPATLAATPVLHTGVTNGCAACHGGFAALTWYNNFTPKDAILSPSHIPFLVGTDCSSCHAATYAVGGFGPTNMSAAKHAFVATTCDTCHDTGANYYLGASTPALQTRPTSGAYDHVHSPSLPQMTTGDCSSCHNTTVWTTPKTLPGGHMPIPGTQDCTVCHTAAASGNYNAYAALPVLHTGITTGCAQCHGGATALTFYNNHDNPLAAPANHIPSFTGNDCSACHTTNYALGGFGPMNMTQATHVAVSAMTCVTCHEAGKSFYMGAANPGLQTRPADHSSGTMLTSDCSACHTTATWNSTALPAGHMPNPGNQSCNNCHTSAPTNYKVFAANAVLHTGIAGNCAQCHGAGTQLSFYNNDMVIKDNVLAPPHIPYLAGADCSSCHSSSTYAVGGFGPMNMTQATHAFVATTCDTCHGTASVSFYVGAASPGLQLRPADHTSGTMLTGDCSGCHTTANWNSTTMPSNHMPNPGNQTCSTCHTHSSTGDYTPATLAANSVLHTGIAGNCILCHGAPNATPPVFATGFTPKDAVLSPVHIPTSSTACESCHASAVFTTFSGTTMSSAKHTAMFAVIGKTCDACHDASSLKFYGVTNLTTRPSGHHVGQDCSNCHNTNNWGDNTQARKAAAAAAAVPGKVGIVVNGTPAALGAGAATPAAAALAAARAAVVAERGPGMNALALTGATAGPSAGPSAGASLPAIGVSHIGVTANCAGCHSGVLASGKGAAHIASNDSCENCHTTTVWMPARFEHRGVIAACSSCHNGAVALGKPTRHLQTNQNCGACHGTIAWMPAAFNHTGVTAACRSCHDGVTATGKQAQHPVTTQDCGACHTTLGWATSAPGTTGKAPLRPLISIPKPGTQGPAPGPQR